MTPLQLLLMLICGSSVLQCIQNVRELPHGPRVDYPHHLRRGNGPGAARTRRVASVWPFWLQAWVQELQRVKKAS